MYQLESVVYTEDIEQVTFKFPVLKKENNIMEKK